MDTGFYISFFTALVAVLNPLGNLPVFVGATTDVRPGVRRDMVLLLGAFIGVFLVFFVFTGTAVLDFFNISLPAFRIAGGFIIFLMGLSMVHGTMHVAADPAHGTPEDGTDLAIAGARLGGILVPIGVPMFVGPSAISTVIVFSHQATSATASFAMSLVAVAATVVVMAVLLSGGVVQTVLGRDGLNIATRILGLFLCAIAVQFVLHGLADSTLGFIKADIVNLGEPST